MENEKKQHFLIDDLRIPFTIHYRKIKYPRIEYKTGEMQLILPHGFNDTQGLIERHKKWIYRQVQTRNKALATSTKKKINKKRSKKEFHNMVFTYIRHCSQKTGQYPLKVTFRKMTSRWGSCNSAKKKITLNTYLIYLPESIIKYVIYHEFIHFTKRQHNAEFWNIIAQEFPDYQTVRNNLVQYWYIIEQEELNGTRE